MARFSGKPVFGVNYRKSVKREHAFPAALQDTISAYAYLLREGYSRIALAGDSAGAGLALALMQYLARFHDPGQASTRPESLIMPVKACLYSPWADLTFSHDYEEAVHFDISQSYRGGPSPAMRCHKREPSFSFSSIDSSQDDALYCRIRIHITREAIEW